MNPIFLPIHDAKEIGLSFENIEGLRRRVAVQRNAFSGSQCLLADGKSIATVLAFDLPRYVSTGYVEALALSGANFACAFRCRDVL